MLPLWGEDGWLPTCVGRVEIWPFIGGNAVYCFRVDSTSIDDVVITPTFNPTRSPSSVGTNREDPNADV